MEKLFFIFIFLLILIIINIKINKKTNTNEINNLTKNSQHLDSLTESDNPDNWFKVAKSNSATEAHLIAIAKKCISIDCDKETQLKIAKAIMSNPSITDHVRFIIAKSSNPDIWTLIWK